MFSETEQNWQHDMKDRGQMGSMPRRAPDPAGGRQAPCAGTMALVVRGPTKFPMCCSSLYVRQKIIFVN